MLQPGDQDGAYNLGSREGDISDERPIDPIMSLGGDLGTHSIPNFMFCPSPPVPASPARACHSFGLSGAISLLVFQRRERAGGSITVLFGGVREERAVADSGFLVPGIDLHCRPRCEFSLTPEECLRRYNRKPFSPFCTDAYVPRFYDSSSSIPRGGGGEATELSRHGFKSQLCTY